MATSPARTIAARARDPDRRRRGRGRAIAPVAPDERAREPGAEATAPDVEPKLPATPRTAEQELALRRRRLEAALAHAAVLVARHGPAFAAVFERLEGELAALQRTLGVVERAKALAAQSAMRNRSSCFCSSEAPSP